MGIESKIGSYKRDPYADLEKDYANQTGDQEELFTSEEKEEFSIIETGENFVEGNDPRSRNDKSQEKLN